MSMGMDTDFMRDGAYPYAGAGVTSGRLAALTLMTLMTLPILLPGEVLTLVTLGVIVLYLFLTGFRIPVGSLSLTWPLLLLVSIGLVGSIGNDPYDVIRDSWYIGKVVLTVLAGYYLMNRIGDFETLMKVVLASGVVAAVYHLSYFVLDPSLLTSDIISIRRSTGAGYFGVVLALAVLAVAVKGRFAVFGPRRWPFVLIAMLCIASLTLSFSRTLWMSLFVMLFFSFDMLNIRNVKKALVVMLLIFAVLIAATSIDADKITSSDRSFTAKTLRVINELKISDYSSRIEIMRNWRGYESYRGLETYKSGSPFELFAGQGFGTFIDMGLHMKLGEGIQRDIPITHNGYIFLLVKCGVVGVILYLYYLYSFVRSARAYVHTREPSVYYASRFIIALSVSIMLATIVVSGLMNRVLFEPAILFIGALSYILRFGVNVDNIRLDCEESDEA